MSYHPRQRISTSLQSHRFAIEEAITNAVDLSFQAAEAGTRSAAQEPDFIAYFFLDGLHRLETALNAILQSSRVRVTLSGIFCHQTPKVYPSVGGVETPTSCELGDLLLVSLYTPPPGSTIERRALGNAVLLQAKMEDERPSDFDPQWQLYSAAEAFRYRSPAPLARQVRSLADAHPALWYWCLERNHWRWHAPGAPRWLTSAVHSRSPWHDVPIHPMRRFALPFSGLVWSLFNGVAGQTFYRASAPATQSGRWSAVVNDLIADTANRALNRNNAYIVRSQPNLLRGSAALRAINANLQFEPGFLVRASLGDSLALMDDNLGATGETLEQYTQKSRMAQPSGSREVDEPPPPLGRVKDDNSDGGMSFIIANWQEL